MPLEVEVPADFIVQPQPQPICEEEPDKPDEAYQPLQSDDNFNNLLNFE